MEKDIKIIAERPTSFYISCFGGEMEESNFSFIDGEPKVDIGLRVQAVDLDDCETTIMLGGAQVELFNVDSFMKDMAEINQEYSGLAEAIRTKKKEVQRQYRLPREGWGQPCYVAVVSGFYHCSGAKEEHTNVAPHILDNIWSMLTSMYPDSIMSIFYDVYRDSKDANGAKAAKLAGFRAVKNHPNAYYLSREMVHDCGNNDLF